MPNILTATEASTVLRTAVNDQNMLDLLPQIDAYIKNATGRDFTVDSPIRADAKSAARMLLVMWYEDPGMIASGGIVLSLGLTAALAQLKAVALQIEAGETP
jgi:hypothetical protein